MFPPIFLFTLNQNLTNNQISNIMAKTNGRVSEPARTEENKSNQVAESGFPDNSAPIVSTTANDDLPPVPKQPGKFGGGLGSSNEPTKNTVPFEPPIRNENNTWRFPKANLVKVYVDKFTNKNGDENTTLNFEFIDEFHERKHTERLFAFDVEDETTDKSGQTKLQVFNMKIRHIYSEFAKLPDNLGSEANTIEEYFQLIANAFNSNGKDNKPIYANIPVYLKLVYWNGYLQFPYSPNFIERVKTGRPCTLTVNPDRDAVVLVSRKKNAPRQNSNFGGGEDSGFTDFPSMS